jgi:aminopeptidase YwaD
LCLLLAACATGCDIRTPSNGSPVPTGASPPAAATAASTPADPEVDRALEHLRVLAAEIGVREAGTPGERRAAEYIRGQFEQFGYRAAIEEFTVDVPRDNSGVLDVDGAALTAIAMTGAPDGEVSGRVVFVGIGRAEDLAARDLRGAIAFMNRGVTSFREKAVAAQRAGAAGLIVANTQAALFRGNIAAGDPAVTIPVVGITSEDADALDAVAAREGSVTLRAQRSGEPFQSVNIVGRPASGECAILVGAHFDSVARAPGANDNASGTSGMLELARTHRLPGLCYAAFGAEELGLFGSEAYVEQHGVGGLRFMLNLDMLGKLTGPEVVAITNDTGSRTLADRASAAAAAAGVTLPRGAFPQFTSSDHASFTEAGVPAVTLHSGDDSEMHTPGDDLADIERDSMATMLRGAAAILRDLAAGER